METSQCLVLQKALNTGKSLSPEVNLGKVSSQVAVDNRFRQDRSFRFVFVAASGKATTIFACAVREVELLEALCNIVRRCECGCGVGFVISEVSHLTFRYQETGISLKVVSLACAHSHAKYAHNTECCPNFPASGTA